MHRLARASRAVDRRGSLRRGSIAACLALSASIASAEAHAQTAPQNTTSGAVSTATDPREAEARALFEQGVSALADERYSDALTAFSRSYEIRRVASVALNLGIALRALGRVTEARQRFNEFLEMASAAQHERHDREVGNYIQDVSRRIARIHIASVEPEQARILVDGRRVTLDERDEVAVDPGEHRVEAQLQGFAAAEPQRVTLESGGRAEVRLRLEPQRPDPRVTIAPDNNGQRSNAQGSRAQSTQPPITSSPWLWVAIGVGVAAAIAVPTAIVLTTREPTLPGLFCYRTDGTRCATGAM
ncbi:MAG: tetratricopeptide repeat protein [Polyangiales bacterium]